MQLISEVLLYLGTGDTDLGTSVDMNAAVRLAANAASDGVGDADDQCTTLTAVAQSH